MPRVTEKNLGTKVHLGLMLDKSVYIMMRGLAQESGVSIKFILRRLIENAVSTREIPWPEKKSNGAPTYDAETEEPLEPAPAGRKIPANRAQ
jgi:hypothetical protein